MPNPNIEDLTITSLDRFAEFMKFIFDQNLADEAVAHLKSLGYSEITISVQPIREIQKMLASRYDQHDEKAQTVILSAHQNNSCGAPR